MAPLARGQSLAVAMSPYGGRVHIGLVADGAAVPDLAALAAALTAELDLLDPPENDAPGARRSLPDTPRLRRMLRVLAVDDEEPALGELLYLLRADPRVRTAEGAGDATAALRRIGRALESGPDGEDAVDVVFLDIHMPGLTGLDVARLLAGFARPRSSSSSPRTRASPSRPST